jgi:hypothetical protein
VAFVALAVAALVAACSPGLLNAVRGPDPAAPAEPACDCAFQESEVTRLEAALANDQQRLDAVEAPLVAARQEVDSRSLAFQEAQQKAENVRVVRDETQRQIDEANAAIQKRDETIARLETLTSTEAAEELVGGMDWKTWLGKVSALYAAGAYWQEIQDIAEALPAIERAADDAEVRLPDLRAGPGGLSEVEQVLSPLEADEAAARDALTQSEQALAGVEQEKANAVRDLETDTASLTAARDAKAECDRRVAHCQAAVGASPDQACALEVYVTQSCASANPVVAVYFSNALAATGGCTYEYSADWGDGTIEAVSFSGSSTMRSILLGTHVYAAPATYEITVTPTGGTCPALEGQYSFTLEPPSASSPS